MLPIPHRCDAKANEAGRGPGTHPPHRGLPDLMVRPRDLPGLLRRHASRVAPKTWNGRTTGLALLDGVRRTGPLGCGNPGQGIRPSPPPPSFTRSPTSTSTRSSRFLSSEPTPPDHPRPKSRESSPRPAPPLPPLPPHITSSSPVLPRLPQPCSGRYAPALGCAITPPPGRASVPSYPWHHRPPSSL